MGGDERRPLRARGAQSTLEPAFDPDEGVQPDRQRVRRARRIGVVVGQLEARNHEQVVEPRRPRGLGGEVVEVLGEVRAVDVASLARRVIGDGEDIEARPAVQIAELPRREGAVAPGRVRVELAEER